MGRDYHYYLGNRYTDSISWTSKLQYLLKQWKQINKLWQKIFHSRPSRAQKLNPFWNDSDLKKNYHFTKIKFRGFQFLSTKDNLCRKSSWIQTDWPKWFCLTTFDHIFTKFFECWKNWRLQFNILLWNYIISKENKKKFWCFLLLIKKLRIYWFELKNHWPIR